MKALFSELRTSLVLTLIFALILCGAYPLAVWAGAQALFPSKANGSLVTDGAGRVRGSALLAQGFSSDRYFQPRPSAAGAGYDATNSGGTNLGPTSAKLVQDIKGLVAAYRRSNHIDASVTVPADAVTRSASGLDPDIGVTNARLQAARVSAARRVPLDKVMELVTARIQDRDLGILGEPRVNVFLLNLALDREAP